MILSSVLFVDGFLSALHISPIVVSVSVALAVGGQFRAKAGAGIPDRYLAAGSVPLVRQKK